MHAPSLRAQDLLRADWTDATRLVAYRAAAAMAAVYTAGLMAGEALHQLNQQLAAAYRCLLVGHQKTEQVTEQVAAQVVATWQGLPLASWSVVELRRVARERLGSATRIEGRRIAQAKRSALLAALA